MARQNKPAPPTTDIERVDLGSPNDGLREMVIDGVVVVVDIYLANARIFALQQKADDEGWPEEQFVNEVVQVIARLGFPTVSHYMASMFINRVAAIHTELQKKTRPGASTESPQKSPDTTSSTPTDGQSPSSCGSTG